MSSKIWTNGYKNHAGLVKNLNQNQLHTTSLQAGKLQFTDLLAAMLFSSGKRAKGGSYPDGNNMDACQPRSQGLSSSLPLEGESMLESLNSVTS